MDGSHHQTSLAMECLDSGEHQKARKLFKDELKNATETRRILLGLATAEYLSGNSAHAILLARAMMVMGLDKEAEHLLSLVIPKSGNDPVLHLDYFILSLRLAKFQQATNTLTQFNIPIDATLLGMIHDSINGFMGTEDIDEGIRFISHVINLAPGWLSGYLLAAKWLRRRERTQEAAAVMTACMAQVNTLWPRLPLQMKVKFASTLEKNQHVIHAIHLAERLSLTGQDEINRLVSLGNLYFHIGETGRAIALLELAYRTAPSLKLAQILGRYCFYHPDVTNDRVVEIAQMVMAEHRKAYNPPPRRPATIDTSRRIRLGYVVEHITNMNYMASFFPICKNHDRDKFDIYLFHTRDTTPIATEMTGSVIMVSLVNMSPNEMDATIRKHDIDILINTHEYVTRSITQAFFGHPARLQGHIWFNLFGSYQDPCMDFVIVPPSYITPEMDKYFTEKVIRMDVPYISHFPHGELPEVMAPPITKNGYCTFGSLSHLYKITEKTIELWSQVLTKATTSHLVIGNGHYHDEAVKEHTWKCFSDHGIARDRIDLTAISGYPIYLQGYDRIDIGLATFPVAGGATITEGVWQGVPILALDSSTPLSRTAHAIHDHNDCPELIAANESEFIEKACQLAGDVEYITNFRGDRLKLLRSVCTEKARLSTQSVERALISLWQSYISQQIAD